MTYDAHCAFVAGETASDRTYDDLPQCPCCGTMISTNIRYLQIGYSTDQKPALFGCLNCETVWPNSLEALT